MADLESLQIAKTESAVLSTLSWRRAGAVKAIMHRTHASAKQPESLRFPRQQEQKVGARVGLPGRPCEGMHRLFTCSTGDPSMCDYSLHNVASRPAKVGDKLTTTRFIHSITRGFAAVDDPTVAVCLLPGTEIAFEGDVEWDHPFKLFRKQKLDQKVARFRQVNTDNPNTHHDSLEFPGGQVVLVTQLYEGQRATVLQLPATARPEGAEAHPERTAEQTAEQRSMDTVR